jgi:hypothetical protein
MWADLFVNLVTLGVLLGYVEYRLRKLQGPSKHWPISTFKCHYCGQSFPLEQRERIGELDYCPEHGRKREAVAAAAQAVKPVARVRVPIDETWPWEQNK